MADDNGAKGFLAFIIQVGRAGWGYFTAAILSVATLVLGAYAEPVKTLVLAVGGALATFWGAYMGVSLILIALTTACVFLLIYAGYQRQVRTSLELEVTSHKQKMLEMPVDTAILIDVFAVKAGVLAVRLLNKSARTWTMCELYWDVGRILSNKQPGCNPQLDGKRCHVLPALGEVRVHFKIPEETTTFVVGGQALRLVAIADDDKPAREHACFAPAQTVYFPPT